MPDEDRLKAVFKAGKRRDYDFNNRKPYPTKEEARAFEDGLRQSMAEEGLKESLSTVYHVKRVTINGIRALIQETDLDVLECQNCGVVVCETHQERATPGATRPCPECESSKTVKIDEDRLDDDFSWRACESCDYAFLMGDALGASEPGSYLCPKCGHLT